MAFKARELEFLGLLSLAIFIFVGAKIAVTTSLRSKDGACNSAVCNKIADEILENMNETVNACDDFYEFSCGGYNNRTIPAYRSSISLVEDSIIAVAAQLENLLKRNESKGIGVAKTLIKQYMDTCMSPDARNKSRKQLLTDFKKFGGFPVLNSGWNESNFDLSDMLTKLFKIGFGRNALINLNYDYDPKRDYTITTSIKEPTLNVDRPYLLDHLKYENDSRVKAYFNLMVKTVNELGADNSTSKCDMKEVLQFLMELAETTMNSSEKANSKTSNMTVGDLHQYGNEINWIRLLENTYDLKGVTGNYVVIVKSKNTLRKLNKLLLKFTKRTLANFMLWSMTFEALPHMDESLLRLLDEYKLDALDVKSREPEFTACKTQISGRLTLAVSSIYVSNFFSADVESQVQSMSKTMINVFNETLASLSWMDDKTRKNAFKKLNSFIYTMGYRSGILNKTVMTKFLASFNFTDNPYENRKQLLVSEFMEFADYLGKPIDRRIFRIYGSVAHKIDAYYHPVLNTAIVTAGLVNAFYSLRNPQFRNYAKIGAIFLHEVTHGFDSSGRERDHNGILNNWWSAQSLKNFNERVDCIVNQFNNYTFFGQKLNGKQTLMENIADSGIRLAYLAYRKVMNDDITLYRLRKYTKKQLFWISAAQPYCSKYKKEEAIRYIKVDSHSISKYRVNGMMSNVKEFSRDFNCSTTSEMNPSKKCIFW